MPYTPLQSTAILCLGILLLAAGGCSRISIAYNSADFLIEQYARDYLALEDPQIASWQPALKEALSRHRRDHLPYLARFFDDAHAGALNGFDATRIRCLTAQLKDLYQRHMRISIDLATPLLATLTSEQIRRLEEKFHDETTEDEADMSPAGAARRDRKRTERYRKSIAWWVGPLSEQQASIIRAHTAAMPDTAADWIAYRSAEREALIKLLEQRADQAEIRSILDAWLVEHRDLPLRLRKARDLIQDLIAQLLLRLDDTLTQEQRAHFAARLADLRDDFMSLQQHPHMASAGCDGANERAAR